MSATLSRGITLIEMLVVLLIMGLLVSVTVLSTGILSRGDSAASDAALTFSEDLSRLFYQASQQALVKNEVLGWSIEETQGKQSMRWWRWSSGTNLQPGPQSAPAWMPAPANLMAIPDLPDRIQLELNTGNSGVSSASAPSTNLQVNSPTVVFFPGREYSAFEIVVRDIDTGQTLARVWPGSEGQMNWGAL